MGRIAIKRSLTLRDYIEMERMERACYGAAHTTPAAEAMRWAERVPTGILAAAGEGGICGFINLLPVDGRLLALLRAGQCNDRDLSADALPTELPQDGMCHLFLSCILVREDLRGTGFAYALTDAAMWQYDGLNADMLITDNVTAAGAAFSDKLFLRPVCKTDYGTEVREGDYRTAREAVRRLAKAYGTIPDVNHPI